MCGIVAFWDKSGGQEAATGQWFSAMLEALACRGPDSAGIALIGPEPEPDMAGVWSIRVTARAMHSRWIGLPGSAG